MGCAFVFPGQGSQYVGMGRALARVSPAAARVFEEADAALGRGLGKLIEEGPEEELRLTWNTQPAILTASVACFRALREKSGVRPVAVGGHSLGEYSALVAAGAMDFADAVRAVEKRGRYMQEAVPVGLGAMYAVLGLDAGPLGEICGRASTSDEIVRVANDNCPGQIVISGHTTAVERAAKLALEAGAKRAVPLAVSAPFHCELMAPAAERLAGDLAGIVFRAPSAPVAANAEGKLNGDPARIPDLLRRQVCLPVLWQDCVKAMRAAGADIFVEIGPGKVLSGLVKRIDKGVATINIEDSAGLDAFLAAGVG
jgi:[acyl-carrier-protein] S-malonyltransferase